MKRLLLIICLFIVSAAYSQTATQPSNFNEDGAGSEANPYKIASLENLYWIYSYINPLNSPLDKHYIQTSDIDASATTGFVWQGIGSSKSMFTGYYNGNGYVIKNFHAANTGLFNYVYGANIQNLGLTDVVITGTVGSALVQKPYNSMISNCYSTGSVNCFTEAGGLVGYCYQTTMKNCYSTASVSGTIGHIGGLIGIAVTNSYIDMCYSSGNVTLNAPNSLDAKSAGGFVGKNLSSSISNSYSTGSVTSNGNGDSSATGGFVGNNKGTSVTNCFSSGKVSSSANAGGFAGIVLSGGIYSCYWDIETSAQAKSAGGTGKTSVEMKMRPTYTDNSWHFKMSSVNDSDRVWNINTKRNNGYPYLNWQYPSDSVVLSTPVLTTSAVSSIKTISANSGGNVTSAGDAVVLFRGICWSNKENPVYTGTHTINGSGLGMFTSSVTGLQSSTTYYVRAYAANIAGIAYGPQVSFITLQDLIVTTWPVSDIGAISASGTAHLIAIGNYAPTKLGICWNTLPGPTIANFKTEVEAPLDTGVFKFTLTPLAPNTTYYLRAYAINAEDTAYGLEVKFTTFMYAPAGSGTASDPYQIANADNFYWLIKTPNQWNKQFIQTADINASASGKWDGGRGFTPIGDKTVHFTGSYDGQGYTISGIYINRPGSDYQGLFGYMYRATIKNVSLTSVNITDSSGSYVAGLAGYADNSSISNCSVSGSILGKYKTGGLAGAVYSTTITKSNSSGSVEGKANVGGLVGSCDYASSLSSCFSTANVGSDKTNQNDTECDYRGGLSGSAESSTTLNCYSKGNVYGHNFIGGLIGKNITGAVNSCYSAGSVYGQSRLGGLIGQDSVSHISNCYSAGSVTGNLMTGGLVGTDSYSDISNCYSIGKVSSAGATAGGLIGDILSSSVNSCFWDIETSGITTSIKGTGRTTAEMKDKSTFINSGWDFTGETINGTNDYWDTDNQNIYNNGYPVLSWQKKDQSGINDKGNKYSGAVPKVFSLYQNYPNPFNPSTTIAFTLAEDGNATLKIYDVLGREIAVLVKGYLQAGIIHRAAFDGSELSGGIYISVLESGGVKMARKLVLMK